MRKQSQHLQNNTSKIDIENEELPLESKLEISLHIDALRSTW